ncbi:DEAD/DEAH box helicase [Luteipulveratus flavus]|uniref:Helicase ATP-binding domain-containing protein n=1 Tax=Luteipulveratus flavus TaxID=3031728 RepID=A0ABT6C8B2_9MICO|nr:hypothetical protein [Luteipulveratus sp. YIM 133296]MDF8265173.1 hypothetical protein [Luteipulveratus sp. YIM 133296]
MSARPFSADSVLAGLTTFQRRTVDHVMRRFHGDDRDEPLSRHFLVADETGLGKSIVAKGVIARTIERLEHDPSINRIDIVYVCSNTDLAKQNLNRLNVTGERETAFPSRLTLLAKHSRTLASSADRNTKKPVNLVSFTPGTSFDHGNRAGKGEERAMVFLMLVEALTKKHGQLTKPRESALYLMLQGSVSTRQRFRDRYVGDLRREIGESGPDPRIVTEFIRAVRSRPLVGGHGLLTRVDRVLDELEGRRKMPDDLWDRVAHLTGELRATLAQCSVATLEPDLIILDEFQRFRMLLDPDTPQGELAHHLFVYPDARVLLLSATPYKPFTYGEEEENHADDFYALLNFLGRADRPVINVDEIRRDFATYRDALRSGRDVEQVRGALGDSLRKVMSRWERPVITAEAGTRECVRVAGDISASDLSGYVAIQRVADLVSHERDHGLVTPEYWKSAPYFASFCQGYRLGTRLQDERTQDDDAQVRSALRAAQAISVEGVRAFKPLDPGGARMRALVGDTLDQGWWRFLWMPPSLPYLQPGGVYADEVAQTMTKRLLFSSWQATPTAVASVLSYEAERRIAEGTSYTANTTEARARIPQGLSFPMRAGKPGRMSTLLVMWPLTRLASLGDPRALARANDGALSSPEAVAVVRDALRDTYGSTDGDEGASDTDLTDEGALRPNVWRVAFSDRANWIGGDIDDVDRSEDVPLADGVYPVVEAFRTVRGSSTPSDEGDHPDAVQSSGVQQHVSQAANALDGPRAAPSEDDLDVLARVALFAPGCISLRVIRRLAEAAGGAEVTEDGIHCAAATLADGLRSLFNRPDVTKLVDPRGDSRRPYWSQVLQYAADGNLEAVLDEWLLHFWADGGGQPLTDESLAALIDRAGRSISLRGVPYQALDVQNLQQPIPMGVGFALRYGARQATADGDARQPEVRAAFNSPFWPFVLASTSVGQEGIDFHWWCHSIFHWNTPANPVDFEQREGRVDRFRGHAVRKNIADRHGKALLADDSGNPWSRAYSVATEFRETYGDFTPDWVFPGPARIERHVAPLAFSTDGARYDSVRRDVALYRLALGQPRQEDLVNALRERQLSEDGVAALRIDLTPPGDELHSV